MSFDRNKVYTFVNDGTLCVTCTECKEARFEEVGKGGATVEQIDSAIAEHAAWHAEQDVATKAKPESDAFGQLQNDLTNILTEVAAEVQPKVQKALTDFVARSGFKFPF